MNTYWKIDRNSKGRDFLVGDVHGYLSQLKVQLSGLSFDPNVDRLFFLGDIVDRGPESAALVEMVDQRTYISILGNHEAMTIAGFENPTSIQVHLSNGGAWFYKLSPLKQKTIVEKLRSWPWALEVNGGDIRVGLVHADVPNSSWLVIEMLLNDISDAWSKGASLAEPKIEAAAQLLFWRRSLATRLYQEVLELGTNKRTVSQYKIDFLRQLRKLENIDSKLIRPFEITGIDYVYMGHSYVPILTTVGNCYFLDTYRGYAGDKLSIHCINTQVPQ
ncbi:metallophosphoesterase [Microbulbifer sp. SSSA007]|uniref:metallophosphoesterase n=1 Tax=Microbulbifer sp. SSSA007 TaxID=3243379 RepID=UPI004039F1D2